MKVESIVPKQALADCELFDNATEALKRARAIVRLAEDVDTQSSGGVEAIPIAMQIAAEEIDKATAALEGLCARRQS